MTSLLRIFKPFIEEGSVSMTSHSDENLDYLYSTLGLSWMRDNSKTYQVRDLLSYYCVFMFEHHIFCAL